jgi:hypothetical protein
MRGRKPKKYKHPTAPRQANDGGRTFCPSDDRGRRPSLPVQQSSTAVFVENGMARTLPSASSHKKQKPRIERGFHRTLAPEYRTRLPSTSRLCHAETRVKTQTAGSTSISDLVGRIVWKIGESNPSGCKTAVQRLASVPSTHTGSVLRSRTCHEMNCIHIALKPVVTFSTISQDLSQYGISGGPRSRQAPEMGS